MRTVFMGTPEFAVPTLDALVAAGHELLAVYTQPPRPAGRGRLPRPSAVQARAEALGIEVRTPPSLKPPEALRAFAALRPDVAVVAAYGLILPRAVLDAPARGCLNVHASLLPRWRGAAPIHRAVMAGDAETGVCVMGMEAGLDTGPVFAREAIPIGPLDTTGDLEPRLAAMGARLMVEVLADEGAEPEPQPEAGVTYAGKVDKAEAAVDWSRPAGEIARRVNGLSPRPGAWTLRRGRRLKLLRARVAGAPENGTPENEAPGAVLPGAPLRVACGTGAMDLIEVQFEGRGRQTAADHARGLPAAEDEVLGT